MIEEGGATCQVVDHVDVVAGVTQQAVGQARLVPHIYGCVEWVSGMLHFEIDLARQALGKDI